MQTSHVLSKSIVIVANFLDCFPTLRPNKKGKRTQTSFDAVLSIFNISNESLQNSNKCMPLFADNLYKTSISCLIEIISCGFPQQLRIGWHFSSFAQISRMGKYHLMERTKTIQKKNRIFVYHHRMTYFESLKRLPGRWNPKWTEMDEVTKKWCW